MMEKKRAEVANVRWIIRLSAAMLACVFMALALLFLLPAERIGQVASDQLERQTGRKLALSGTFRPTLFPVLGAKTGPISVSNAPWAEAPDMISAQGLAIGIDLSALLAGRLQVRELRLIKPVIELERASDGRVNWALGPTTATPGSDAPSGAAPDVSLDLGTIDEGRIVYVDRSAGTVVTISALSGTLSLPADASQASAALTAVINGTPAKLDLELADRHAALAAGASALKVRVQGLDTTVTFDGVAALTDNGPDVTGAVNVSVEQPSVLARLGGIAVPEQLKPLRAVTWSGQVHSGTSLTLSGTFDGTYADLPLSGHMTLGGEPGWQQSQRFDADMALRLGEVAALSYNGRVSGSGNTVLNGMLDASARDLRRALRVAGVALNPPQGTLNRASVKGAIELSKSGILSLQNAQLSIDANTLTGLVEVRPEQPPYIRADLRAQTLDLSKFTGDGGAANDDGTQPTGWSKAPIAIAGLDAIDADVALRAGAIDLGPTKLGKTDVSARLRSGLMRVKLNEVHAFDGVVVGTLNVHGGRALSFTSDLRADGMQLEPLLGQLAGLTRLTGTGATRLKLKGHGGSVDALISSLSGTGEIELGKGAIRGINLAAMMQNLKSAFGGFDGATEFTSLTGTFQMNRGVLQNVDLSLITPLFRAGGKGSVDLGGQAMNYVVTPTRFSESAQFTVPVTISGPWSNLRFRPDLESLVNLLANGEFKTPAELEAARAKLKEVKSLLDDPSTVVEGKLKRELSRKLTTELALSAPTDDAAPGTATAEPQKAEDVLKSQIKRKLLGELGLSDPAPAPPTSSTGGTALALSTPGLRPRLRPDHVAVTGAVYTAATPAPAPADTRSVEERVKDDLEDKAKSELKKLFGLGN